MADQQSVNEDEDDLPTRVAAYIEQHELLPERGEIIVALSGGADSLCLLDVLQHLCGPGRRFPGVTLQVAHLNHMLRGAASERDAAEVVRMAEARGVPIVCGAIDVPALARAEKRSLEDAARVARYRFLRKVAAGRPIAVAHQADDQVETLLLHWLRGSGLAGLTGIAPRQGDIIRPLLEVTRAEINAYCLRQQITPLEDLSNSDPRFLRNRVRHELLPLLESLNPGIRETLQRNAEVLRADLDWIERQVDNCWLSLVLSDKEQRISLSVPAFQELPLSLQRHLLRRVTARLCGGQSPLEPRHYALIERIAHEPYVSPEEGRALDLPGRLRFTRSAGELIFSLRSPSVEQPGNQEEIQEVLLLPVPGRGDVPGTLWRAQASLLPEEETKLIIGALARGDMARVWQMLPRTPHTAYVDGDSLGETLQVRTWRPGDRIQPLGMQHTKKVQDVFVDKHIPRAERASIPLFFAGTHCLWLAGVCLAEPARLSATTRRIVRLSISPTGE